MLKRRVVNNFNKKAFCFCSSGGGRVGYPGVYLTPGYPTSLDNLPPGYPTPYTPPSRYPTPWIPYPLGYPTPGYPTFLDTYPPRYSTPWKPYPPDTLHPRYPTPFLRNDMGPGTRKEPPKQTDAFENITLPQLLLRVVIVKGVKEIICQHWKISIKT